MREKKAEIIITLYADGQVSINAPTDKILSLGMLEIAKHTFMTQQNKIQAPPLNIIERVLGAKRGAPNG
jgi:ArsR family metal-binding transcriptional regulator